MRQRVDRLVTRRVTGNCNRRHKSFGRLASCEPRRVSGRVKRIILPLVDTRGLTAFGSHVLHAAKPIVATTYNDGPKFPGSKGLHLRTDLSFTLRVSIQAAAKPNIESASGASGGQQKTPARSRAGVSDFIGEPKRLAKSTTDT